MNTIQSAVPWIRDGLVVTRLHRDYTVMVDPATRKKFYIPKLRSRDRHLRRLFRKAERAVEYRDEVVERCRRWTSDSAG